MPTALVHAYPWDFDGAPAADRAADLGVRAVAVAAGYHATRAAGPLHPTRPLVDAPHAALYVPVRAQAWAGRRLVPRSPAWVGSPDSFGDARGALSAAGLETHAWLVLTHTSALGAAHPDLAVRNAFGHPYSYGLCPSAPDVVEYCLTLVEEVLAAGPVDGLVLEACGPMGVDHNGLHDKTSLAEWDPVQRQLLSLCCCGSCTTRLADAGVDVADLRRRVRAAVGPGAPAPGSVEQALGEQLAATVSAVRAAVTGELRRQVLATARRRPGLRVTLHADPDPWSTGSFAPVPAPLPEPVDALVASCDDTASGARALPALRAAGGPDVALGGVVRPRAAWADPATRDADLEQLRSAGLQELHLYHLGLVGPTGLEQLRALVAALSP